MLTARYTLGGCGLISGALGFGGMDINYVSLTTTEKWSGTSWATTSTLPGGRMGLIACGLISGALCIYSITVDKWSGTSWATTIASNISHMYGGAAGDDSTSIISGGGSGNAPIKTELWSGTAWRTTVLTNNGFNSGTNVGTSLSTLMFGVGNTEKWSSYGDTWTDVSSTGDVKW